MRRLGDLLSICLWAIVLVIFYWMMWPMQVSTYSDVKMITGPVKVGGKALFSLVVDKKYNVPAQISRSLVSCDSDRIYPLPMETGTLPAGKRKAIISFRVPDYVEPGFYKLDVLICHEVTPLQSVPNSYQTPCFEVIK